MTAKRQLQTVRKIRKDSKIRVLSWGCRWISSTKRKLQTRGLLCCPFLFSLLLLLLFVCDSKEEVRSDERSQTRLKLFGKQQNIVSQLGNGRACVSSSCWVTSRQCKGVGGWLVVSSFSDDWFKIGGDMEREFLSTLSQPVGAWEEDDSCPNARRFSWVGEATPPCSPSSSFYSISIRKREEDEYIETFPSFPPPRSNSLSLLRAISPDWRSFPNGKKSLWALACKKRETT